jgi:hypothetical protein
MGARKNEKNDSGLFHHFRCFGRMAFGLSSSMELVAQSSCSDRGLFAAAIGYADSSRIHETDVGWSFASAANESARKPSSKSAGSRGSSS